MDQSKMKMVYTVVEREKAKPFWCRIGVGFVNRDNSLTLRLDAMPVNGSLQVRDWEPKEDRLSNATSPQLPALS